MTLDLSRSNNSLTLLEPLWILEPLWVLAAMLLFLADPKRSVFVAAGLALLALSFAQRWLVTGRPSQPTLFDVSWGLLLAGAIVGLWASYDLSLSLPILLALIGGIALYYTVANAPRPMLLAQIALLAGLVVAVYFLTQYQRVIHPDKISLASALGRVISGFFPPLDSWEPFSNGVATLLEGLLPLGIALTLADRSRGWRMISGVATGAMGLAILVAASYDVWVALLAAGTLWLAGRWRRGAIVLGGAAVVALTAAGAYLTLVKGATLAGIPVFGPVLHQLLARPDRLEIYQGSIRLIQDFPLTGVGLGKVFALVYSKYVLLIPHVFLTYSHSLYLTVWLGHGLLGMVGMGWLVVALGSLVVRKVRGACPAPLFQAAWTGVAAILVHGLFDARQYVDSWTMWPLFFLLGLIVSTSSLLVKKASVHAQRVARSRRREWVALVLLAGICAVVWRPLLALTWANLGAVQQAKAELAALPDDAKDARLRAATVNYERALRLAPNNRTAGLRLGNLMVADGRYAEGLAHLENVWRAAPEDRTACKALGLAYVWVGEINRATELLVHTRNIVAELNAWGWWHGQEGRQQEAMRAYQTSLALKPDQPQVRNSLAMLEGN